MKVLYVDSSKEKFDYKNRRLKDELFKNDLLANNERSQYDIIHFKNFENISFLKPLANNKKILLEIDCHLWNKKYLKYIQLANAVLVNSKFEQQFLQKEKVNKPIYVKPLFGYKMPVAADLINLFRRYFSLYDNNKIIVGLASAVEDLEGFEVFIQLVLKNPNFKFIWFCYGDLTNYNKIINTHKFENCYCCDLAASDLYLVALHLANIFVFPTVSTYSLSTIIDVMHHRKNSLIAQSYLLPDFIKRNYNCYISETKYDFIFYLNCYFENKILDLSEHASRTAESQCSLNEVVSELAIIYKKIVG